MATASRGTRIEVYHPRRLLFIVTLLLVLIVCDDWLVGAKVTKKPPFNGSIFGKRSVIPTRAPPPSLLDELMSPSGHLSNYTVEEIENQWHESLLKATIQLCLATSIGGDLQSNQLRNMQVDALCSNLLADLRRSSATDVGWLSQLMDQRAED